MPTRLTILMDIFETVQMTLLNILSFGWILAAFLDWLPTVIGVLVGLSVIALNVAKAWQIFKGKSKKK